MTPETTSTLPPPAPVLVVKPEDVNELLMSWHGVQTQRAVIESWFAGLNAGDAIVVNRSFVSSTPQMTYLTLKVLGNISSREYSTAPVPVSKDTPTPGLMDLLWHAALQEAKRSPRSQRPPPPAIVKPGDIRPDTTPDSIQETALAAE